ncbi:MAG: sigma-70 family RNA polymerase sigma factor [Candidatus Eremiobacteraeota bacterium]|nr:sigma-70 family RNA polymerase sigma factor [Candidatus Eremiobacteraeota bacterium]
MNHNTSEHLFRNEAGRMVAALTRLFGLHNLTLAEDVVQDAFCRALEVWKLRGVPENPSAWLMKTAKNRALDLLRRERTARTFAPDLGRLLQTEWTVAHAVEEIFDAVGIPDDQLRMMFSCCHPRLVETAQVMLTLHLVGGFGAREIANAFVSTHAAVEKRLTRAKKTLAQSGTLFDIADAADFAQRLPAVQRALYLVFSEGYHGASAQSVVRTDLCREAIRLTRLLAAHPLGDSPSTRALCALMHLDAARLPARLDASGDLSTLFDQDRSRWDRTLIETGKAWLERSAFGSEISRYHVEAAIAAVHAAAARFEDTDWEAIVALYDTLVRIAPSPIVALNRAIALAQLRGPRRGLDAIDAIADRDRLLGYPFYHAARGELERRRGATAIARGHFEAARALARNPVEERFLDKRIAACTALLNDCARESAALPRRVPRRGGGNLSAR